MRFLHSLDLSICLLDTFLFFLPEVAYSIMIYGIGTDLVQLSRIAHTLDRFGDRFVRRILSPLEIAEFERYTQPKVQFLASR